MIAGFGRSAPHLRTPHDVDYPVGRSTSGPRDRQSGQLGLGDLPALRARDWITIPKLTTTGSMTSKALRQHLRETRDKERTLADTRSTAGLSLVVVVRPTGVRSRGASMTGNTTARNRSPAYPTKAIPRALPRADSA